MADRQPTDGEDVVTITIPVAAARDAFWIMVPNLEGFGTIDTPEHFFEVRREMEEAAPLAAQIQAVDDQDGDVALPMPRSVAERVASYLIEHAGSVMYEPASDGGPALDRLREEIACAQAGLAIREQLEAVSS
jgi:hypothetical protein